jgi:hypothetical protein
LPVKRREVYVPFGEVPRGENGIKVDALLEKVFYYGQNEFAIRPSEGYSLSVGDIAKVLGKYYIVLGVGWREISHREVVKVKAAAVTDYGVMELVREFEKEEVA